MSFTDALRDSSDPGIVLFRTCAEAWHLTLPTGARVLELGCCESDLADRIVSTDTTIDYTGVDVRPYEPTPTRWRFIQGDWNAQLFVPRSYDVVLMVGALEHVGLGFYGDPPDAMGDEQALQVAYRCLKPGGWLYYDVPYQVDPLDDARVSDDGAWRSYSLNVLPGLRNSEFEPALERIAWSTEPPDGQLIAPPLENRQPFWFVATLWRKL